MLVQSRPLPSEGASEKYEIEVLPALPSTWPNGRVTGLRARGAFEIDLAWIGHALTNVRIRSVGGREATVRYSNRTADIKLRRGDTVQLDSGLQRAAKPQ